MFSFQERQSRGGLRAITFRERGYSAILPYKQCGIFQSARRPPTLLKQAGPAGRLHRRGPDGGGEGSRTPVRNIFHAGLYTFIRRSGISEGVGPAAAFLFLETCRSRPGARLPGAKASTLSVHRPPPRAQEFGCRCQLSSESKLVRVCIYCFERLFRRPADQPPRATNTANIPSKPERPRDWVMRGAWTQMGPGAMGIWGWSWKAVGGMR